MSEVKEQDEPEKILTAPLESPTARQLLLEKANAVLVVKPKLRFPP